MNSVFLNDHQLADQGWGKMSSLLDKEMPQPRKRRPVFWWAAAVLTGAFLLYEYQGDQSQQVPSSQEALGASVVIKEQSTTQSFNNINTKITTSNTIGPSTAGNPGHKNTNNSSSVFSPGKGVSKNITAPLQATKLQAGISGSMNLNPITVVQPEPHSSQESTIVIAPFTRPELSGLSPIPSPSIALLSVPSLQAMQQVENKPVVKTKVHKRHPSKASFGLMIGANAFQVKQVPGFVGGLTLDFFPFKRFGLQTGLLYRYQVYSGESRPVIPISYDKYVQATANYDIQPKDFPNSWIYLSANNSVLIPVLKSHQIEMPAMLFWQMHPRWRMYGGMTLLRHVWIESAEKGLFTYDLQVVTTPDDADAAGNLNNAITGQLPAWEKNWQAGFSFKPVKRLEIGLFYRSAWNGKPLLSDVSNLFGKCSSCNDSYPEAAQRTGQSLRPRSLQLNATLKF